MIDFTFDEVAQLPVPVRIRMPDGSKQEYSFPRLGVRGLVPWLAEISEKRKAAGLGALAKTQLQPIDRWRAEKAIAMDEAIIGDLATPMQKPEGVEKVLRLSLATSDVPVADRESVLATILSTAYLALNLAQELSTLFVRPEPAALAPDAPMPVLGQGKAAGSPLGSPAEETPATSAAAPDPTGSPTASLSNGSGPTTTP